MNLVGRLALASLAIALAVMTQKSMAQAFPNRAVKIVVPYGTGGTSDILARQLAAKLQAMWGQGVIVENRPGAGGAIGTEAVVRSPADGYTLLLQNNSMLVTQALIAKPTYDPVKDLTPLMLLGQTPMAIVANPGSGITSLADLVSYGKSGQKELAYASCGPATPHQFLMELVKRQANFQATHVPYRGCAPAVTDVLAGQVPVGVISANIVAPYVSSGKLVGVAISTATRYDAMPNTKSLVEQGQKSLDFTTWYALMAPASMPQAVSGKIIADVNKVLAMPDVKQNLVTAGIGVYEGDAMALAKLIQSDQLLYAQIAKSANIKAD